MAEIPTVWRQNMASHIVPAIKYRFSQNGLILNCKKKIIWMCGHSRKTHRGNKHRVLESHAKFSFAVETWLYKSNQLFS